VIFPVEVLVKATLNGDIPVIGLAVKPATGGGTAGVVGTAVGVGVCVSVAVLVVVTEAEGATVADDAPVAVLVSVAVEVGVSVGRAVSDAAIVVASSATTVGAPFSCAINVPSIGSICPNCTASHWL
jgi:hypothetical protein